MRVLGQTTTFVSYCTVQLCSLAGCRAGLGFYDKRKVWNTGTMLDEFKKHLGPFSPFLIAVFN